MESCNLKTIGDLLREIGPYPKQVTLHSHVFNRLMEHVRRSDEVGQRGQPFSLDITVNNAIPEHIIVVRDSSGDVTVYDAKEGVVFKMQMPDLPDMRFKWDDYAARARRGVKGMTDAEILAQVRDEYNTWLDMGERKRCASACTFQWVSERLAPLIFGEMTREELGSIAEWAQEE